MDHIQLAHTTHTPGYRNEKRSFSLRYSSRSPKFFAFPPLIDLKVQNFRPIAAYCGSFCRVFVSSVRRSSFFVLFSAHFVVKSYLYVVRHLFALFRLAETRSAPVFVMFVLFVRHDVLSHLHVIVPVTCSLEKSLGSSTEKLKTQSAVARSLLPNFLRPQQEFARREFVRLPKVFASLRNCSHPWSILLFPVKSCYSFLKTKPTFDRSLQPLFLRPRQSIALRGSGMLSVGKFLRSHVRVVNVVICICAGGQHFRS